VADIPSVAVKLTVYVPGAVEVVGVHVNVLDTGAVPWTVAKLAPDGVWLA